LVWREFTEIRTHDQHRHRYISPKSNNPISQGEIVRPADLGLSAADGCRAPDAGVEQLIATGNTRSIARAWLS